jgi:hypothetical protein
VAATGGAPVTGAFTSAAAFLDVVPVGSLVVFSDFFSLGDDGAATASVVVVAVVVVSLVAFSCFF